MSSMSPYAASVRHDTLGGVVPNQLCATLSDIDTHEDACEVYAIEAVAVAASLAPKLSGLSSSRFEPIWGTGWYGIQWFDRYVWFQEQGIRPFTMRSLQGKVIPMWIDDPYGEEGRANPDAKRRETADGRQQVLIFRRAANSGERRRRTVRRNGVTYEVDAPASYPGAPGRINRRWAKTPFMNEGRLAGRIARGNVGVRWRHPGTEGKYFLWEALTAVAASYGAEIDDIWVGHSTSGVSMERAG